MHGGDYGKDREEKWVGGFRKNFDMTFKQFMVNYK